MPILSFLIHEFYLNLDWHISFIFLNFQKRYSAYILKDLCQAHFGAILNDYTLTVFNLSLHFSSSFLQLIVCIRTWLTFVYWSHSLWSWYNHILFLGDLRRFNRILYICNYIIYKLLRSDNILHYIELSFLPIVAILTLFWSIFM